VKDIFISKLVDIIEVYRLFDRVLVVEKLVVDLREKLISNVGQHVRDSGWWITYGRRLCCKASL
jgi:hypothetical protein